MLASCGQGGASGAGRPCPLLSPTRPVLSPRSADLASHAARARPVLSPTSACARPNRADRMGADAPNGRRAGLATLVAMSGADGSFGQWTPGVPQAGDGEPEKAALSDEPADPLYKRPPVDYAAARVVRIGARWIRSGISGERRAAHGVRRCERELEGPLVSRGPFCSSVVGDDRRARRIVDRVHRRRLPCEPAARFREPLRRHGNPDFRGGTHPWGS